MNIEMPATEKVPAPELAAALAVVQQVEGGEAQVRQALATAREAVAAAEAELEAAQRELSSAEASAALGADVDRAARRRFSGARDAAEFAHARVSGLEARLTDATTATNQTKLALARAWRDWQRARADEALAAYSAGVDTFLSVIRKTVAAGAALGSHRILAITRAISLPSPDDPTRDLTNPRRLRWADDPDANAAFEALAAVRRDIEPHIRDLVDAVPAKLEPDEAA